MLKLKETLKCLSGSGNTLEYEVIHLGFWVMFRNSKGNALTWMTDSPESAQPFINKCLKASAATFGEEQIRVSDDLREYSKTLFITIKKVDNIAKLGVVEADYSADPFPEPTWFITIRGQELTDLALSMEAYYGTLE